MSERFEAALERNPLRQAVREIMEVRPLKAAIGDERFVNALHIACGNGRSTALILKHFEIGSMRAFDRSAARIAEAKSDTLKEKVEFSVQEATRIDFGNGTFDAVFDLADIHNYAAWEQAIGEIYRVLRPGGLFLLEELSSETFEHGTGRWFKRWTDHPYDSMFSTEEFKACLERSGFSVTHFKKKNPLGLLRYFVIAARKAEWR